VRPENQLLPQRSSGLVDVLDRVLEKGLVVAGDVKISLAEVELLTIRIRLIVCSIDKAQQIGLDWWRNDRYFGPPEPPASALAAATAAPMARRFPRVEHRLPPRGPRGGTTRRTRRSGDTS
jgi:hypothetical protein